jgi:galactokinase
VNLIGEHTDYNGGYVLPSAIPQRTTVQLTPRSDQIVRVFSEQSGVDIRSFSLGSETPVRGWLDYIQGLTRELREAGHRLLGFDVHIDSAVPLGSGLSSSAALSVALLRALRSAFTLRLSDVEIALLGQRSENRFVGAQVGIMDPMACSLGQEGAALFIDTRTMEYRSVPLPPGGELVVIHSGVAHRHAAGDYNTRRGECEQAARLLGVGQLRDVDVSDLPRIAKLRQTLGRRARHVVTENQRVLDTVEALGRGDWKTVGRLFRESHASQRDDYEVSVSEIDLLVDLASQDRDVFGARLTGGGFGGSIVIAAKAGTGSQVGRRIAAAFADRTGHTPAVLVPAPDKK